MNILFIGDVVGKPGIQALKEHLPALKERHSPELVIANAENAAGGFGLTPQVSEEMFQMGIDVLTSGNHIFDKKEIIEHLGKNQRILRPANYPGSTPGSGSFLTITSGGHYVGVLNLMGRVFIDSIDCPFKKADEEIEKLRKKAKIIFVDMHAEVTSEKVAMGHYLDGRVSAVVGTHTHIQTADDCILPKGSAYLTDAGMTGPVNSVIGITREIAISRFLTRLPRRMETCSNPGQVNGALISIDPKSGRATAIERINIQPANFSAGV